MSLNKEIVEEINVLLQFNRCTTQEGLKVHSSAAQSTINGMKRLHAKGMVTRADGGYLTFAGRQTASHAQSLYEMLTLGEAKDISNVVPSHISED